MTSTLTVENKDQLTSTPLGSAAYDNNGNIIAYVANYSSGSTTRNCVYDDENRLVSVFGPNLYRADFGYDGLGRLRTRTNFTWTGTAWSPGPQQQYIYDDWRVIQERTNDVPTVSYTRGRDLSGTLEGAGGIGGLLARSHGYSAGNWSTHSLYFADGNGNVVRLLNSGQAVVASYRYDPFGNATSFSGARATANTYRFSSKEAQLADTQASPIYYYGYRFYDPILQRWPNRDPIQERGGINLYTFVQNEPVYSYDPFGTDACTDACGKQNLIDLAVCWVVPIALTGGVCYFFPPACAAAARAGAKAALVCTAAAEARYLACIASCAARGKCPPYPIGPYVLP